MFKLPILLITFFSVLGNFIVYSSLPLGPYKISDVTISGFSSGGFLTVQVHVAYSSVFKAAAVFAGAPYYCTQAEMKNLVTECSVASKTGPNITALVELTKQFELEGKIDPVANLKDDQVFLFVGTEDSGVGPAVGKSVETYYQNFVDNSRLNMNHDFPADHTLPTLDYGSECTKMRPPFIGKCNYDGAGLAFKHIFGDLKDAVTPISTNLMAFDQTPYIPTDNEAHSIGDTGYIYVPTACQEGSAACHLHFSFHGCGQTVGIMGDTFAANTGYNRWAESNNIVVVYPSAKISLSNPTNPIGCWDASGFTGTDYSFKSGVQPRFVRNLVSAIAGI